MVNTFILWVKGYNQDVSKAARFPRMFDSNLNKQVEKFASLSFSHHLSFFSRVEYYTQYSSGVRGALYIVILLLYSSQNNNKKQEGCVQVRHQRDYQVGYNGLLTLTLLPILDQNHKGSVLRIAKVPLQISSKH